MWSYQYGKSYPGNKIVVRPSYLHRGILYICKLVSLLKQMLSYQYRKSHCRNKIIVRLSDVHNWIPFTDKTDKIVFLYWNNPLVIIWYGVDLIYMKYFKLKGLTICSVILILLWNTVTTIEIVMALCETDMTPFLTHWCCVSFSLTHWTYLKNLIWYLFECYLMSFGGATVILCWAM